jgi:hypothetical protein
MSDTLADRYRALFTLSPAGAVIWQERTAQDFAARFNLPESYAAGLAQSWAEKQAGRAPAWRKTTQGDLVVNVDRSPVSLANICQALGADFETAKRLALARSEEVKTDAIKSAVLRLVAIDGKGRLVWRARDVDNAPKTPPAKREEFNKTWAGRALVPRAGGMIQIQRQAVTTAQARAWLEEQDKVRQGNATQDDATPEELTPETVAGWRASGMSTQDMIAQMKAMGWNDLPDSALLDILKQY